MLEEAARQFGAQITFHHHAFQLRPAPVPLLDPKGQYLQEHWTKRVYPMAAERGLPMQLPPIQVRTRRAHETAAFAREHGVFAAVDRALFAAFFEAGLDIDDVDVLASIVKDAGLEPESLRAALSSGAFGERVDTDVALAARLGVQSVPTMLVGEPAEEAEPVVGAVPYEWFAGAITRGLSGDDSQARLRRRMVPQLRVIE